MAEKPFWANFKNYLRKNIPNYLTAGNLMLGMLALLYVLEGRHQTAISLLFIAMLLDGLDGKLAVHLKAGSPLGKQLDSLADLVSFGVLPAIILYAVSLNQFSFAGLFVTLLFPVAGAYRLARFNLRGERETIFHGLPITIAGGALASLGMHESINAAWPAALLTLLLALLMVSRIHYPAFKGRQQEANILSFLLFYGAVIAFTVFIFSWREFILYMLFLYIAAGPLFSVYRLCGRLWRKQRRFVELRWVNRGQ